jgi:hypothetical protein
MAQNQTTYPKIVSVFFRQKSEVQIFASCKKWDRRPSAGKTQKKPKYFSKKRRKNAFFSEILPSILS